MVSTATITSALEQIQPCGLRKIAAFLDIDRDELAEDLKPLLESGAVVQQHNGQYKVGAGKPTVTAPLDQLAPTRTSAEQPLTAPAKPTSTDDLIDRAVVLRKELNTLQAEIRRRAAFALGDEPL